MIEKRQWGKTVILKGCTQGSFQLELQKMKWSQSIYDTIASWHWVGRSFKRGLYQVVLGVALTVGGFSKDNETPVTTTPADLKTELTNSSGSCVQSFSHMYLQQLYLLLQASSYLSMRVSFTKGRHNKQHITLQFNINAIILIRARAGV